MDFWGHLEREERAKFCLIMYYIIYIEQVVGRFCYSFQLPKNLCSSELQIF